MKLHEVAIASLCLGLTLVVFHMASRIKALESKAVESAPVVKAVETLVTNYTKSPKIEEQTIPVLAGQIWWQSNHITTPTGPFQNIRTADRWMVTNHIVQVQGDWAEVRYYITRYWSDGQVDLLGPGTMAVKKSDITKFYTLNNPAN